MLEILTDGDDKLIAVCDWWIVNADGSFNPQGEYIWINELQINPDENGGKVIRHFINAISSKCPNYKYAYFWRERKYGKKLKMYSKRQWEKLI